MASSRTTLIIPVESQARELDAKLLLACAAAERGFPVVIGSRAFLHYQINAMPTTAGRVLVAYVETTRV